MKKDISRLEEMEKMTEEELADWYVRCSLPGMHGTISGIAQKKLTEYLAADPAGKIPFYEMAFSWLSGNLLSLKELRKFVDKNESLEKKPGDTEVYVDFHLEGVIENVEKNLRWFRAYIEKQRGHIAEIQFPVPSNPVTSAAMYAIWAGGPKWETKGKWKADTDHTTAVISRGYKPRVDVWVEPKREAEAGLKTMAEIEKYLARLSPRTADVMLCVLSAMAEGQKPLVEPVIIDTEKIIQQKGMKAWGRQRAALEADIERDMEDIARLRFTVENVPLKNPETGKYKEGGTSWKGDKIFDIVEAELSQKNIYGQRERIAVKWSVRAGQWAYYFLSPNGQRWVCNMAGMLLQLSHREDRKGEVLAKKLGLYVQMQKWILGKGQKLEFKLSTLFNAIGENPGIERKPGRFREAFEAAIDLLKEKKMFSDISLSNGYWEDTDRGRGWVKRWLEYTATFTLPDTKELQQQVNKLAAQKAKALPAKRKRQPRRKVSIDGREVRRVRMAAYIRQEDLAGRLGISRVYLSAIENGKQLPSEPLARKIQKWLVEHTNGERM